MPLVVAAGSDGGLRQVGRADDVESVGIAEAAQACVGALARLHMVAAGSSSGSVACLEAPFFGGNAALAAGLPLHCGAVTRLLASHAPRGSNKAAGPPGFPLPGRCAAAAMGRPRTPAARPQ